MLPVWETHHVGTFFLSRSAGEIDIAYAFTYGECCSDIEPLERSG